MPRVPTPHAGAPLRRRLLAVLATVLAALPAVPAAAQAPATGAAPDVLPQATLVVDPALLASVGGAAVREVPAVLSWDDQRATRAEVLAHLDEAGIDHAAFSHLDMAVACVGSRQQVDLLAATPGAVSVWGDEHLVPALDAHAVNGGLSQALPRTTGHDPEGEEDRPVPIVTGADVGIAVLDTGIDGRHPDLAFGTKVVQNTRVVVSHYEILGVGQDTCAPDTFMEEVEDSETTSGHGTALAGIAAGDGTASGGATRGVAPDADLIGISVLEQVTPQSDGDVQASLIRFIAGVNHLLSNSLVGGPATAKVAIIGWTRDGLFDPFHPHFLAIRDLWDFGVVPVVPVGNGGTATSDCSRAETCTVNPLAAGSSVIAVGAATADLTTLEDFSSRGDPQLHDVRGTIVAYQPFVVAPGTALAPFRPGTAQLGTPVDASPYAVAGSGTGTPAADPDYQAMQGTSVAAANIAGVIALMQEAAVQVSGCYLRPHQVRSILRETADAVPGYQPHEVGFGAIDVEEALVEAADLDVYGGINPWDCVR